MVVFRLTGGNLERIFSLGLLLLLAAARVSLVNGQQGVSLMLSGATIPNDGIVDLDDIRARGNNPPSDADSNGALLCITDLQDCCDAPNVRGEWYFPDDSRVESSATEFRVNRGASVVRLWRRFSAIPGIGRFRCEIPNAANSSISLYANILDFGFRFNVDHVIFSPSTGSTTAGEKDYSLSCSMILFNPVPLPSDVPSPNFQWSFDGSASLPSGVTAMPTVMSSSNSTSETYTNTLQFSSPLSQSLHTGMYTCRPGSGKLVNSIMVTVNAPAVSVQITTSGAPTLEQSYTLTCGVTGAENLDPSTNYVWTKNNGTQTQVGADRVLSFSPLRLSDAGRYTCQATVSSPYLNNNITMMDTQDIRLQIPNPTSVMLSSSISNPIPPFGSNVTLTCVVVFNQVVDVPVTINTALNNPDGFPTASTAQPVMGGSTNYVTTSTITSFGRSNSGTYVCAATVRLTSTNTYISDSNTVTHIVRVTTDVYLALSGMHITNNSNINIRNIGQTSDNPNGALQCITDNFRCCIQNPQLGEWYLPNGALAQGTTTTTAFYRNRGANGEMSLNRPSGVESPTGLFCCEVPDATNTNQTLCVNIGGLSTTVSGSPIAGESYTLECSIGGSEGTFQWLGPPDGRTPVVSSGSITISSTSTTSRLQFRPVQQSNNGSYVCSATVNGLTITSEPVIIVVNALSVSVQISDGGATPAAGESYQLTCSASGAGNLNAVIAYSWTKNSGSGQTQVGTSSSTLSFTPLRLSDAASYVCEVTIRSSYLTSDITAVTNFFNVTIQFPTPSSISLSSDHSSNSRPILGSDITLTCTLELNSAVVPSEIFLLMVDAQLFRDGTQLTLTGPIVTGTAITYTTQLNSFGSTDSGNYNCTATVRPEPALTYLTGSETLSTAVSFKAVSAPPLKVQATQSSSSAPVEVSWSPPSEGADIITGYRIYYGNGQNILVQSVATYIGLRVDGDYVGQNISIRSEADRLYSELVSTSVTIDNDQLLGARDAEMQRSCSSEVGIAIGAIIIAECLVVMVIIVVIVFCLWRKRSAHKNSRNSNIAVSANMAYGEVNLKPGVTGVTSMEAEYENPDKILKPSDAQWNETTTASNYETIDTSKCGLAKQHASTDDSVCK